ncbi:MAG: efflux transporter outer membrane subunit [Pseudomonadota bacterium]
MNQWMIFFSLVMLASCSLTPEYERPDTERLLGEEFAQKRTTSKPEDLAAFHWWKNFNDPVINDFINAALENNLDIKVAAANVLETQALVQSAVGSRWPEIGALVSGDRSFTGSSTGSSFNAGSDRLYTTTYVVGSSITWQSDLFGRLRSNQKASIADWQASQTDREAIMHTVIANVIRQRVELAIAMQRLSVAEDILKSRNSTLDIVKRRYSRGVHTTSAVDVKLARENIYSAEANIFALQQNVSLAQHALDILLGEKPKSLFSSTAELNVLPVLDDAVTGVPAQLLDRRPDLRAAEFRIKATNERVGVAIADLYPDLTITGAGGWRDSETSELFLSDTLFGSIMGELTQTLFAGGRLRAEVDAAKARLESQAHTYLGEVLQAIREVEDSLVQNHQLKDQLEKVDQQVTEARQAENLSRKRYSRGVENLLTVLETERRRQNAEDSLLQVKLNYWNARIDLYLALGGDWLEDEYGRVVSVTK